MIGECRMSNTSSTFAGVDPDAGIAKLSHTVPPAGGVLRSPSPVCQMPYLFNPADVWKPHGPDVLYSHIGFALIPAGVLAGWRIDDQPPLLLSKVHGILSPTDGPLDETRTPRSNRPFGTMSGSQQMSWTSL